LVIQLIFYKKMLCFFSPVFKSNTSFWNSPNFTTAKLSDYNQALLIESKVLYTGGDRIVEMITKETWTIEEDGNLLKIKQFSNSFWGERNITMAINRF
jgi:hypothetical protein